MVTFLGESTFTECELDLLNLLSCAHETNKQVIEMLKDQQKDIEKMLKDQQKDIEKMLNELGISND